MDDCNPLVGILFIVVSLLATLTVIDFLIRIEWGFMP